MKQIKQIVKKLIFEYRIFYNKFFCLLNHKKFKYKVAIISNDKWANKVNEDKLICIELNKNYIYSDIVSWESNANIDSYDAIIIRSVWGYADKIEDFYNWIENLKSKKKLIINAEDILLSNMNKYIQFKLLDKYNIPHIDTIFLDKNHLFQIEKILKTNGKIVVKPIISGGGNNTFVIPKNNIQKNSADIYYIVSIFNNILNDINNLAMVQPFIEEIDEGELSIVYIDGKLSHAAYRFTNVFNNKNQIRLIPVNTIDIKPLQICNKILKIKEYNNSLYMRADFVKINNEYKIMEVELVDPQLFLEYRQTRKNLKKFADSIKKRLQAKK